MRLCNNRKAFTLIEILLALGIIAILAAMMLSAINPSKQITSAKDARHDANTRALHSAVQEYIIDEWSLPNVTIPVGESSASPICLYGTVDASCVNLDVLVPDYLADIPADAEEANPLHTGYVIYQDNTGQMRVTVPFN